MKLLYGKPVVEHLFQQTQQRMQKNVPLGGYVAFLLLSDDGASTVYVTKKRAYAKELGIESYLFQNRGASIDEVIHEIDRLNVDPLCIGIVVQLPLAPHLCPFQPRILNAIDPKKDVDGLGGVMFGKHLTGMIDFLPATPKAVYDLLAYYDLADLTGKKVLVIGQSNLVGKPFALEAMHRGATVYSANSSTSTSELAGLCQMSEYIISATGVVELVTPALFGAITDLSDKIIIDIGYGIKDGKALGDTDWKALADLGATITPVPGGVGPVTVASLFHNIVILANI